MRVIASSRDFAPTVLPGLAAPAAGRGIVDVMLVVGVLMLFCLSGYALEFFGIPYVSAGGSILSKLHPSLYVFSAALIVAVLAHPDPLGYGGGLIARRLGAVALIVASAIVFVIMARLKPTLFAAFLVDSIAAAGVIVLVLADTPPRVRLLLARLLHIVVATNCALAIVEVTTGWRLFPFGVGDQQMVWDYRATALFGHPLDGALAVGVYTVILITTRDVPGLASWLRIPLILLAMASMPAIGGRTSFGIVYAVAAVAAGIGVWRFLAGGRVTPLTAMVAALGVPVAAAMVLVAIEAGMLDNFIGRFQSDSGSASARLELFALFRDFGLQEWFVGYDVGQLRTQVRVQGLESGIENAWAQHLLLFGLPLSLMLWCALAAFLWEIVHECGRQAILPVLFLLVINTSSVGIAGKTTMLVLPVSIILILLGGGFRPQAVASQPLGRSPARA
ncbi:MAG: VpsF family polysaccharide biosynthesis protein [Rhizobiaceae bacterium]|nr:VpsF family polysaccharide biosynthesis protein [Rhizobiaceae bacterium]